MVAFGRLPSDPTKPKLKFGTLLAAPEPVPAVVDYLSAVPGWPMYSNDRIGCCTVASVAHAISGFTTYGQGSTLTVSEPDVLAAYSAVSGWDPARPETDRGAVLQDVLSFWRKTGVAGNRILAFAAVNVADEAELSAALHHFGHLLIGFDVYQAAIDQFEAGQPWTVPETQGSYLGGHAVTVGYDNNTENLKWCVTWARIQPLTDEWFARFVDEAWIVVTEDWLNATSRETPAGLDLEAFAAEFTSLTGQPDPFTSVPEPPSPPVEPPPAPAASQTDRDLAGYLQTELRYPYHKQTARDRTVMTAWLTENHL